MMSVGCALLTVAVFLVGGAHGLPAAGVLLPDDETPSTVSAKGGTGEEDGKVTVGNAAGKGALRDGPVKQKRDRSHSPEGDYFDDEVDMVRACRSDRTHDLARLRCLDCSQPHPLDAHPRGSHSAATTTGKRSTTFTMRRLGTRRERGH